MSREAARAEAGVVAQFVGAKQGEMAAHQSRIEVYERLAEVQQRLGVADRAADARAHAQRAREGYRMAAAELAAYLVRIEAVEDARARRRKEQPGQPGG